MLIEADHMLVFMSQDAREDIVDDEAPRDRSRSAVSIRIRDQGVEDLLGVGGRIDGRSLIKVAWEKEAGHDSAGGRHPVQDAAHQDGNASVAVDVRLVSEKFSFPRKRNSLEVIRQFFDVLVGDL